MLRDRGLPFMYETVTDASLDGGGGGEPEPVAEAAPEPVAEAAPAIAEPDYGAMLSSSEGQQALQQAVMQAMEGYQPEEQYGYGQEEPAVDPLASFDFLSDDAPTQLGRILEERDQRLLAAMQQMPGMSYAAEQQQTTWANDAFSTIEKDVIKGELKPELREISIAMAAGSRPPEGDPQARYFDPNRALGDAAQSLHTLIQREREAAVRDYQQGVTGEQVAGATEPPASGLAAVQTEAVPQNMREAREAWERREGLR
jgi:hypothetical protein